MHTLLDSILCQIWDVSIRMYALTSIPMGCMPFSFAYIQEASAKHLLFCASLFFSTNPRPDNAVCLLMLLSFPRLLTVSFMMCASYNCTLLLTVSFMLCASYNCTRLLTVFFDRDFFKYKFS